MIEARWLGRIPYLEALALQRAHREQVLTGDAPEALWLLEHPAVITTGLRSVSDLDLPRIAAAGIPVVRTERGGLATWHGPGQLVGYLIADLPKRRLTVRGTVHAVEQGVIDWLAGQGVVAGRREGMPGVWIGRDKVCAIGMHFRRGVSMHGFALNLDPDLSAYALFTPCGIRDGGITSVRRSRGDAPLPEAAAEGVAEHVLGALRSGRR